MSARPSRKKPPKAGGTADSSGRKRVGSEEESCDAALKVPAPVKRAAELSLAWMRDGVRGGTETGWRRARQLAGQRCVDLHTLRVMRAWFARHGPDAINGGTSYRGYVRYRSDGTPNRGALAWLLWGGDDAYLWLKTPAVRRALARAFPKAKAASARNNLVAM